MTTPQELHGTLVANPEALSGVVRFGRQVMRFGIRLVSEVCRRQTEQSHNVDRNDHPD